MKDQSPKIHVDWKKGADPENAFLPVRRGPNSGCLIASIIFLIFLLGGGRWILREHWQEVSSVALSDERMILVHSSGSEWRHIGMGHGMGVIGGGGFTNSIKFGLSGKAYEWKGSSNPIVLQEDGRVPVLVTFDRETDFNKITFRYFRNESQWQELPLTSFPPRLAIQNMWHKVDEPEGASLEAKLRYCILQGTQYWEVANKSIDEDFLKNFKQDHLKQ